jgi:hypothetical protein
MFRKLSRKGCVETEQKATTAGYLDGKWMPFDSFGQDSECPLRIYLQQN